MVFVVQLDVFCIFYEDRNQIDSIRIIVTHEGECSVSLLERTHTHIHVVLCLHLNRVLLGILTLSWLVILPDS